MTTSEMEALVMNHFDFRKNIVVPGVSWGIRRWPEIPPLHECDVLSLTKSGYATEIEIKVSRADLLKDKDKKHGHKSNFIKDLYFAVPEKLKDLALKEIPERAGLLVPKTLRQGVRGDKYYTILEQIKPARPNKEAVKWREEERIKLMRLGCMRIYSLKNRINKLKKQKEL